jgi:RimJ/RimL family protein N-acetyltransferase
MFIKGHAVTLRSLEVADADTFYLWSQDREITQFSLSSYAYPQSQHDIAHWLGTINQNPNNVTFGICCIKTGKLVGYAGLAGISRINRLGEYFILIGDKHYWGKGVATNVTQLITAYGFRDLGLHRIELTAFVDNKAAIKAYESAGYQHEGIKRQAGFRHGGFYDKVQMSVLVSDEMPEQKPAEPDDIVKEVDLIEQKETVIVPTIEEPSLDEIPKG